MITCQFLELMFGELPIGVTRRELQVQLLLADTCTHPPVHGSHHIKEGSAAFVETRFLTFTQKHVKVVAQSKQQLSIS